MRPSVCLLSVLALTIASALSLAACGGEERDPDPTPDAGTSSPDAGDETPDAGDNPPDAGEETPDAGGGTDRDRDGVDDALDCAPDDPTIYPGAPELCDDVQQDCDGTDPAPEGTVSFFPTGGAGVDLTATLSGPAGGFNAWWDVPESGTLRFCGGTWTRSLNGANGRALIIESRDGMRATLEGAIKAAGDVTVRDLDVRGWFWAEGGTATAPSGRLLLEDVDAESGAGEILFTGTMVVTVRSGTFDAEILLGGALAGLDWEDVVVEATSGYEGAHPMIHGASVSLSRVTSTTAVRGFAGPSGGPLTVTSSTLTAAGPGEVLSTAGSYTISDTTFVSASSSGGSSLQPLLTVGGAGTMTDLEFDLNGHRGGLAVNGSATCDRCTFSEPARHPAVELPGTTGGLTLRFCEFVGLPGAPIDGRGFVVSHGDGIHRIEDSTFTNGYRNGGGGGAVAVTRGTLFIDRSTFTGNRSIDVPGSGNGGAILAGDGNVSTTAGLYVTNSTFADNSANAWGGAIWTSNAMQVTGSTFTGNASVSGGGALVTRNRQTHTIDTSVFHSNTGGAGAAILWGSSGTNTLRVTDSDLGESTTDNSPSDVQMLFPDGTTLGTARSFGAGATFTCNGTQTCG